MRLRLSVPLAATLLSACNPGLAGDWEGDIRCDDVSGNLSAELEKEGGGEYEGSMEEEFDISDTEGGVDYRLWILMEVDLVLSTDGRGEQELDVDAELADVSCKYWEDGDLLSDNCGDLGAEFDIGASFSLGEVTWDGKDSIEIDDGDCSGELER